MGEHNFARRVSPSTARRGLRILHDHDVIGPVTEETDGGRIYFMFMWGEAIYCRLTVSQVCALIMGWQKGFRAGRESAGVPSPS